MLSLLRNVDRWNLNLWTVAGYYDLGKVIGVNHTKRILKIFAYISLARTSHMTMPNFKMMGKCKPIMYLKGELDIMAEF